MNFVVFALMLAVLGVLIVGIFFMMRGGEGNEKYGNKLMVWRVALQGGVILLLGLMFLLRDKV